jgi:hypothetical protein
LARWLPSGTCSPPRAGRATRRSSRCDPLIARKPRLPGRSRVKEEPFPLVTALSLRVRAPPSRGSSASGAPRSATGLQRSAAGCNDGPLAAARRVSRLAGSNGQRTCRCGGAIVKAAPAQEADALESTGQRIRRRQPSTWTGLHGPKPRGSAPPERGEPGKRGTAEPHVARCAPVTFRRRHRPYATREEDARSSQGLGPPPG